MMASGTNIAQSGDRQRKIVAVKLARFDIAHLVDVRYAQPAASESSMI